MGRKKVHLYDAKFIQRKTALKAIKIKYAPHPEIPNYRLIEALMEDGTKRTYPATYYNKSIIGHAGVHIWRYQTASKPE